MMRVNLLAPRLPSRQSLRLQRLTRAGSLLLLLISISVGAFLWAITSQNALSAKIAQVDAALAAEGADMAVWQSIAAQVKEAESREETLALIPEPANYFRPLIVTLDDLMPAGCSLLSVVVEHSGEISLMGSAAGLDVVAAYLDQVRALPGMKEVELQSTVQPSGGGWVTFKLHMVFADLAAGGEEGGQNE